ncbi:GDSL-type esterase/lipase family protein [Tautonia sociabilis]|uniref:SGNH hydrolase-type esterase domain-containing protein n=1 Tax=Tautonia sociabilis TaxID=2080755 RepID=A0A432MK92_9BACT|nr:GDSL-type esterase/lipase family protein [Tautonia sociabilis]RUL87680.1 hypothetical protein TsocGM_10855 [Tautonia sociabilis]
MMIATIPPIRSLLIALASFGLGAIPGATARAGQDAPPDPDPSRFSKEIEAFELADRQRPPSPGGILFVGSSSIRRWDLEASFPEIEVTNRGFGGSQLSDAIHFADRIIAPHRPRLIVLYEGDNDINAGKSAERVRDDLLRLADRCRSIAPEATLIVLSIKPSPARADLWPEMQRANALFKRLAAEHDRIDFVDVASPLLGPGGEMRPELYVEDELHLNDLGYAQWAEVLRPILLGRSR